MMSDNTSTKTVVIAGGGTAGWLTAARLAAKFKNNLNVILVESPNIATVGVGEGTWPTMRNTLKQIGVSETDFLNQCDATFKQGAKFAGWVDGSKNDYYYHPLMLPNGCSQTDLAAYWQTEPSLSNNSFSTTVCLQEAICEKGLAPKLITSPEYGGIANYAYHLDAGKFAKFLQKHCVNTLGVEHILEDIIAVKAHLNGDIASVQTQSGKIITGELFVDCTGFSSILLGKHYDVPFIDKSKVLFIDNALAVHIPYQNKNAFIASNTVATGQEAGWIWDIGLTSRRGLGYVYSSSHTSENDAEATLRRYIKNSYDGDFSSTHKLLQDSDKKAAKTDAINTDNLEFKKIPIKSGHRKIFWKNNCVAVGLSAGFLEPLEASALVLVELSAEFLCEQFPTNRSLMEVTATRFNRLFTYRWEKIIDFLKLHYILTQRFNDAFWMDNRDKSTIPDSLSELMALWEHRAPQDFDFDSNNEVFPAASYQYVLYGMGYKSSFSSLMNNLQDSEKANQYITQTKRSTQQALLNLPNHRELLNKVREYGFQAI